MRNDPTLLTFSVIHREAERLWGAPLTINYDVDCDDRLGWRLTLIAKNGRYGEVLIDGHHLALSLDDFNRLVLEPTIAVMSDV